MYYAANVTLHANVDTDRIDKFAAGLRFAAQHGRRPHLLYGTLESLLDSMPIVLEPLQNSYLARLNPLDGSLSVESDKPKIAALMALLEPFMKSISVGYVGEVDDQGLHHGQGSEVFPSGDCYKGQWVHGVKCGVGTFEYSFGDVYEGAWWEGKRHGAGVMSYANGDKYTGDVMRTRLF